MKLLVETLETELSQDFTFSNESRYNIGAIIPYLYLHNAPSGTFQIELIKDSVTLYSETFTSSDIKASVPTVHNYVHIFYPIVPDHPIYLEKGSFTVKLSASGYSVSSSSFIGWIRQFEDLNNILDYIPADDGHNPLATRIKVYERGIK